MSEATKTQIAKILLPLVGVICLTEFMPPAAALVSGILIAVVLGNPYAAQTRAYTHRLLAFSVMGLGAGMNLMVVARVGLAGFGYTVVGISVTLALGMLLARLLKVDRETGLLITVGTAICGGSAIAAIAPAIRAKPQAISVSLGTVFLLNAVALVIFPPLGHYFELAQTHFGLWCALAIHDTSSVVGAASAFGDEALKIATTVKLARALWIIPLTVVASLMYGRDNHGDDGAPRAKPKRPWFILGFVIAAAIVTWIPETQPAGHIVELVAKRALKLTLFLIGANLTLTTLKAVGVRPLIQGFVLWLAVGSLTLGAILVGWVR